MCFYGNLKKQSYIISYCEQTLNEEQRWFKCVYSMMPKKQISFFLNKMEAGKNSVESKRKKRRERKREAGKGSVGQSVGDNQKQHGLRNDR